MSNRAIYVFCIVFLISACKSDGAFTTSITSASVNSEDALRLFGAKLKEAIKTGNVNAADDSLELNIDTGTHYYDGVLSVDFSSKTLLQAGYITAAEFDRERLNLAGAVDKAILSINSGFMNLGAENYITGLVEYYLEQKEIGGSIPPSLKQTVLDQAESGTNWNRFLDNPTSTVSSDADRVENIREVALTLESLVDALILMQEDGDVIPQNFTNKLDGALSKLKSIVNQLLSGEYLDDRAQNNFSQAFYNGLTGVALIRADEYFLKYNGQRDPEIEPLVKRFADWMLLGGGAIFRYDISAGVTAGDSLNYQIVQAGVVNPQTQTAVITSNDILLGYVEINIPVGSNPSGAGITNVNAPFNSNLISRTEYKWLDKDVRGSWAIKYASHNTGAIVLADDEFSALSLINIVNPMFAWLHKMGHTYGNNLSYKDAYWGTFMGPLLYTGAWNFAGSASGKFYNQLLYKMRYAWEWLGVNGAAIKPLTLQPLSASSGSLTDNEWVLFGGDTADYTSISNNALTFDASAFSVNHLSLPDAKALQVKIDMGVDPALSTKISLFAGGDEGKQHEYQANFALNFINLTIDGGSTSTSLGVSAAEYEFAQGDVASFRIERVDLQSTNPDTTDGDLIIISYFDENDNVIGALSHVQQPKLSGGNLGFRISAGPDANTINIPVSDIRFLQ